MRTLAVRQTADARGEARLLSLRPVHKMVLTCISGSSDTSTRYGLLCGTAGPTPVMAAAVH